MAIPFAHNNNIVRPVCKHVGGTIGAYNNNSEVLDVMESMEWEVRFSCLIESPPAIESYLICEFLTTSIYLNRGIAITTNGRIKMKGANEGGYGYMLSGEMGLIADNKIHDVIVRRKDSTFYTIVDGVSVSSANVYGTGSMYGDCNVMCIGQGRNSADWTHIQYADDFYIWNVSFNKTNWVKGLEFPFTEGTGTSSYDINGEIAFGTIQGWAELNMTTREASVNYSGNDENTVFLWHGDDVSSVTSRGASGPHSITYNGTSSGGYADGAFTESVKTNGDGAVILGGNTDDWDFDADDFTIDFWVKPTSFTSHQDIFTDREVSGYASFLFHINSSAGMYFYGSSVGTSWDIANLALFGTVTLNTWYHVALTRSGTAIYGFLNGVKVFTLSTSSAFGTVTNFRVGGFLTRYSSALMSEIRMSNVCRWSENFTPNTRPYGDGDYSVKGNDANTKFLWHCDDVNTCDAVGATTPYTLTYGTGCTAGDGDAVFDTCANVVSGYYISTLGTETDLDFGDGDFTIEFWVNFDNVSGRNNVYGRVDTTGRVPILIFCTDGVLACWSAASSAGWSIGDVQFGTVAVDTWYHVALVRNGDVFTTYLNGVKGASITSTHSLMTTTNHVSLGSWATDPMVGKFDEVRISDCARYNASFEVADAPYGEPV